MILFGVNALICIIYDIMASGRTIYIHRYMCKLGSWSPYGCTIHEVSGNPGLQLYKVVDTSFNKPHITPTIVGYILREVVSGKCGTENC